MADSRALSEAIVADDKQTRRMHGVAPEVEVPPHRGIGKFISKGGRENDWTRSAHSGTGHFWKGR